MNVCNNISLSTLSTVSRNSVVSILYSHRESEGNGPGARQRPWPKKVGKRALPLCTGVRLRRFGLAGGSTRTVLFFAFSRLGAGETAGPPELCQSRPARRADANWSPPASPRPVARTARSRCAVARDTWPAPSDCGPLARSPDSSRTNIHMPFSGMRLPGAGRVLAGHVACRLGWLRVFKWPGARSGAYKDAAQILLESIGFPKRQTTRTCI